MELALVIGIIRSVALEAAEKRLRELGVHSITVTKARGSGAYGNVLAQDWMVEQARIEVFTRRDQADLIAAAIADADHTGLAGDGTVAILAVERVLSACSRSDAFPFSGRRSDPARDQLLSTDGNRSVSG